MKKENWFKFLSVLLGSWIIVMISIGGFVDWVYASILEFGIYKFTIVWAISFGLFFIPFSVYKKDNQKKSK